MSSKADHKQAKIEGPRSKNDPPNAGKRVEYDLNSALRALADLVLLLDPEEEKCKMFLG